jgi:hypothetical protein
MSAEARGISNRTPLKEACRCLPPKH